MSTTLVVSGVTICLLLLIAIAVTQQTLERNAREKRRLESTLNARSKITQDMIDCFKEGMLSTELQTLLYNRYQGILSQLCNLAPRNQEYANQLTQIRQRIAAFKSKPTTAGAIRSTDKTELHDIETMLGVLHNLVNKLAENNTIDPERYQLYTQQLRRLYIQTANNALIKPTQQAIDKGKLKVAIHYLQAAKLKMTQEDEALFSKEISELDQQILQLETEAQQQETEQKPGSTPAPEKASKKRLAGAAKISKSAKSSS